jgi:anti-anti-sigma regulatory factor
MPGSCRRLFANGYAYLDRSSRNSRYSGRRIYLLSWHTGCALTRPVMLRITSGEKGSSTVLRLEGWLTDPYIAELRRSWMEVATGRHIVVDLADVRFIAPAGKALLVQMFRSGVAIVGRDAMTRAIRDEVAATVLPKSGHRQRGSRDESER